MHNHYFVDVGEVEESVKTLTDMVERLETLTWIGHFNFYRALYSRFTFEDRKKLYRLWYNSFPPNCAEPCDGNFVADAIGELAREKAVHVAELGGNQGELALQVLNKHPDVTWVNYEIIRHKLLSEMPNRYEECVLDMELWQRKNGLTCDAFVSTHTLEHFSDLDFDKLLRYLFMQDIPYLILQLPIKPEGQTWSNYYGSHKLTYGSDDVKEVLGKRYTLIREVARDESIPDKNKRKGWCSFWRLKNEDSKG